MTTKTDEIYAKLEEAGVWIQSDNSGVGHNWKDLDESELKEWILDHLYTESGELVAGTETLIGTVPFRLRACKFA